MMTQKDKVLNCLNCRIGDFKRSLCDCHNGFCAKYKGIGTEKDFFKAIEALQERSNVQNMHNGDLISKADAIKKLCTMMVDCFDADEEVIDAIRTTINEIPSTEAAQKWIPIKWHEITEEEREREGYPKDWVVHIDCDMPSDGEEILVQTKRGYIGLDICYEEGEFFLDSGWDWIEDIVAWMPRPKPYRKDGEEE